ncbi:Protein kinase-like domain [Phytophthora cactorum]|nr:Protein kinase-like domain [Phytophthora cactorum]
MSRYLMMEQFSKTGDCEEYLEGKVFLVNNSCVKIMNSTSHQLAIASMDNDSSMGLNLFDDDACATAAAKEFWIGSSAVNNSSCYDGQYKLYSEITVAASCLFFWCRRRSTRKQHEVNSSTAPSDVGGFVNSVLAMEIPMEAPPTSVSSVESSRDGGEGEEESHLWRDETILGVRAPREKVAAKRLISREDTEKCTSEHTTDGAKAHRTSFLAEMKLMLTLEHPRIVRLIGIAWDSPNDLCALIEFVPGGDLRALLNKYAETHRPIGFTYERAKIASDVAHALTYLHSLNPPVIHRDLKSKSILLTHELDAKITDFGDAAAPYTGTKCSSASSYLTDMATAFSSSPYVIVQKYNTGKACADAELSGITTYLADGKCHKTDTATSYRVTRSADNSASIKTYTDAVCTNGGVVTTVSTADGTSNACVLDAKVYGAGTTPLYLTSTVNYDTTANTCSSGTPVTGLKTTDYVMVEQFEPSTDCEGYFEGRVFLANDSCIKMINSTSYQSAIASVYKNDSLSLKMFDDNACSTTAANTLSVHSTTVARHLCFNNMYKFFSENQYTSSSGSFSSLGK